MPAPRENQFSSLSLHVWLVGVELPMDEIGVGSLRDL